MRVPVQRETVRAWGQTESLFQPRRGAFWVFVVLTAFGTLAVVDLVTTGVGLSADAASLALVLWAVYTLPFFLVIWRLDLLEPEPVPFLAAAFVWGGVVATSIAAVANDATATIIAKAGGTEFARDWTSAIAGPSTEEVLKGLGVVIVVLVASRQVSSLVDGLVYGATVGLAFQVVENFLYCIKQIARAQFLNTDSIDAVSDVFVVRGVFGGLWSHAVYSAIVGLGIAYFVVRRDESSVRRLAVAGGLLLAACGLHFLWNSPWFRVSSIDALLPKIVVAGVPALVLLVALVVFARNREVVWFEDVLQSETGLVRPEELASLHTLATRRAACREDRRRGGRRAGRLRRELQQAQVRFAVALARADGAPSSAVEEARADVAETRAELDGVLSPPIPSARA
jgi:RsiW-degrading membrane proteinase PrsW (M82 family)